MCAPAVRIRLLFGGAEQQRASGGPRCVEACAATAPLTQARPATVHIANDQRPHCSPFYRNRLGLGNSRIQSFQNIIYMFYTNGESD